jgi:hypothetical protein
MEHINLIRKIAWSFHKTTGLEWEELFQEASLGYCLALKSFDPNRGQKLTTYVWMSVACTMFNYIKKTKKFNDHSSSTAVESLWDRPANDTAFETSSFLSSLTKDAQEIVNLILNFPEIFGKESSKEAQTHIVNILQARGWEKKKIAYAMKNIKTSFNS